MHSTRGDGYLTTAQAATLVGVAASTIRAWRRLGYLEPVGLDERGHPLHTASAVRAAEMIARANGIRTSGIDPRALRTSTRSLTTSTPAA